MVKSTLSSFIVTCILFIISSLFVTHFTIHKVMNFNHFTYWNYTLGWLFYGMFIVAALDGVSTISWYMLLTFPPIFSSMFVVTFLIRIILYFNDWLLLEDSLFGVGKMELGEIQLGDFILHSAPFIGICIFIIMGGNDVFRRAFLSLVKPHYRGRYYAYMYIIASILLLVYAISFDPRQIYPTPMPFIVKIVIIAILLLISTIIQGVIINMESIVEQNVGKQDLFFNKMEKPRFGIQKT